MSDFSVTMTEDRLKVILDCDLAADGDLSELVSGIVAELNRLGLGNQVDPRGFEEWLRRKLHGKSRIEKEILIEGQPPEYGQDGKIEWLKDFFTEGFEVDPATGALDYRRPKSHRAVEAGQALARYTPPTPSRPGKDVFGKVIEVPKPADPGIRAGQNVEYRTEEDTFYSTATGRVAFVDEVLSVDPVFHIEGNVGLETGNIGHPGPVAVEGDVEAGAEIIAKGDVEIHGILEAARVVTQGSLLVHGGIAGSSDVTIEVDGEVHAKFILDATIRAKGAIVVEKEIRHSSVYTRSDIVMPKGDLIGGETKALGTITVNDLGSDALTPTEVWVGEDYWLPCELARYEEELSELQAKLEKIEVGLEPLKKPGLHLAPEKEAAVAKLEEGAAQMRKSIDELQQAGEQLKQDSRDRRKTTMLINAIVFPESIIHIRKDVLRVRDPLKGPVEARLEKGRVILLPK